MNIYLINNKITQKKYVGQTKNNIYERWGRHILDAYRCARLNKKNSLFHEKIIEFSPENFEVTLLEQCSSKDVDEKERYWINYYDSYNNGYNSTLGGQDKEALNDFRFKKGDPRQSIYSFQKGNKLGGKRIIQYSLSGEKINEFETAKDAAEYTHGCVTSIRKVCNLNGKTSGGFQWRWAEDNPPGPLFKPEKKMPDTKRKVVQKDKDNNIIKYWDNPQIAGSELNINPRCIIYCCNKKQKTAGKFMWEFY